MGGVELNRRMGKGGDKGGWNCGVTDTGADRSGMTETGRVKGRVGRAKQGLGRRDYRVHVCTRVLGVN